MHSRQHYQPLMGQDLALSAEVLMGWLTRDFWTGEVVDDEHPRSETAYQLVRPGVALLRLSGALGLRESWCCPLSYDMVVGAVESAVSDLAVGALVVQAEGPGGFVGPLLSASARIRKAVASRGIPVYVHTQAQCMSAWSFLAQSIAGNGGTVSCEMPAQVGMMGVYRVLGFTGGALEQAGIKVRYVSAGTHKVDLFPELDPDAPEQVAAIARAKGQVDAIYDALCRDAGIGLAMRRGVAPDEGYALIRGQDSLSYIGTQEAIDAGVVDRVATLDEILDTAASAV